MPKFKSREEYEEWKARKLEEVKGKAEKIKATEKILPHISRPKIQELFEEETPPKPFIEQLPGIFSYPLTGTGKFIIILGSLIFGTLSWLARFFIVVPLYGYIFAIMVTLFIGGYLSAYFMKIITRSADGESEPPDWPEVSEPGVDIVLPFFQIFGTILICFAPSLIYFFAISGREYDPIFGILFLFGLFYLPMALIAISMSNTLVSLNPFFIISSIFKIRRDYIIACIALLLIVGIRIFTDNFISDTIPFFGYLISYLMFLYFLMIEARIIGLIYNSNRHKLSWFGEGQ